MYIFSILSLFNYNHAIVLPDKSSERDEIISLNIAILGSTTVIFSLLLLLIGDNILEILNAKEIISYKYTLIILFIFSGFYIITRNIFLSEKKYTGLSKNNVIYQIIHSSTQLGFGILSPKYFSLLLGQVLAFAISSFLTFKQNAVKLTFKFGHLIRNFRKHIKFLYFETPSAFLNTFSLQMPILFITKYHGVEYAGYYSMALIIVNAPMSLLSGSITQVYFKSASDLYKTNKDELLILYKNTFKKLTLLIIIPSIVLILTSDLIVEIFLGANWSNVSWILQIYIFSKIFEFLHTPLNTTLLILNKQEVSFYMMAFGFIIKFISLFIFRFEFENMIISLTIASSIYHLAHNYAIYRIIKNI